MLTLISESQRSLVYHYQLEDGRQEVWKIYPDESVAGDFMLKELELSSKFTSRRFRKALTKSVYRNQHCLVLEYIPWPTLRQFSENRKLAFKEILYVTASLVQLLDDLSGHGITHNRINPDNLLIEPNSYQLALIDFSKSEEITFTPARSSASNLSSDELPYFSPELTGHLHSKVDFRSDLYSAGMVIYELSTGQLPFENRNHESLLYDILVTSPTAITNRNTLIPKFFSDVISKLLAKPSGERYNSVFGLRADIEICKQNLDGLLTRISPQLGAYDSPSDILKKRKVYGREKEMLALKQCVQNTVKGEKTFVQILGETGSGKTSLVRELRYEAIKNRSLFIYGKYVIGDTDKPFYALQNALQELASQILCQDEHNLLEWKDALSVACGEIGKVLTDFIPEFKLIIGEQPQVPALDAAAAQSRFLYLLQRVMEHIANYNHPIILCLDDFQWADQSSYTLIDSLMQYNRIQHFMLVITSRNGLKETSYEGLFDRRGLKIHLTNLSLAVVRDLVGDFRMDMDASLIAKLIHDKTEGNPFYIIQLIQTLQEEHVLKIDSQSNQWICDTNRLAAFSATENVVDLIIGRINSLSANSIGLLRQAACIGKRFNIKLLTALTHLPDQALAESVQEAVQKGLVQSTANGQYDFVHDRIQENVYSTIGKEVQKKAHLRIATELEKASASEENMDLRMEAARHYYLSGGHILLESRIAYITLNYQCGVYVKQKAAFPLALEYFRRATAQLNEADWITHYELAIDLYIQAGESAVIAGDRHIAEVFAKKAITHSKSQSDRFRAFEVLLNIMNENHDMLKAVDLLVELVNELGFSITRSPNNLNLLKELVITRSMLWSKKVDALSELPKMTHEPAIIFMRLTAKCTTSIFSAAPEILPLIIFKQVQTSLKYGNSMYSPVAYAAYGFALSSIMGQLDQGFRFGQMAIRLASLGGTPEAETKVRAMFYGFLSYWKTDIKEAIPALKKTYILGRETGDLLYASFAATFHSCLLFFTGEKLSIVRKVMEEDSTLIKQMKQDLVYVVSENQRQMVTHFTSQSETTLEISGDEISEEAFMGKLLSKKDSATLFDFYAYKLFLSYMLDTPAKAIYYVEKALEYEDDTSSHQISYPHFLMFTALAAAEAFHESRQGKYKARIKKALKKLGQIVKHAPFNFSAMHDIAKGTYFIVSNRFEIGLQHYKSGIESARASQLLHLEALGYELVGAHYSRQEAWSFAEIFLRKAYATYDNWGAAAKCRQIATTYLEINFTVRAPRLGSSREKSPVLEIAQNNASDVHHIFRNLTGLIKHQALADKVTLLVKSKTGTFKEWPIENDPLLDNSSEDVHVPNSLVNFIRRTEQSVLCPDVLTDHRFASDKYVLTGKVNSFMGFPIMVKGEMIAIVYVENNRITAYEPDNFESINTLIGISVENALLLEEHEAVRSLEKNLERNLLQISHLAEENERKRIAADLHDDIGALLSTIKLYMSHKSDDSKTTLNRAEQVLDEAIKNVREIAHRLSPAALQQFGFVATLQGIIQNITQSGAIAVNLTSNLTERLPEETELQLYRIYQELLNNTIKYASATEVHIEIKKKGKNILCIFSDNGIGFNLLEVQQQQSKGKGIGIPNIYNRARSMNAKIQLRSSPGNGFVMNLEIEH